ncbi:MAG: hypothetical protein U9M95_06090 [Candidatus Altiarchaeota archaeon]|nr:hypothetical protein [Candidatus Altiarchaeota archaeon]
MRKYLILGLVLVVVFLNGCADKAPSAACGNQVCNKTENPDNCPADCMIYERIKIIGDSPNNGIADVSIEYGPDGVGWMTYSAVEIGSPPHVSTHLAKSSDNDKIWEYVKKNQSLHQRLCRTKR